MKCIYINTILFLSFGFLLNAQPSIDKKRDYQWIAGYKYDNFDANLFDFNQKPMKVKGIYGDYSQNLGDMATICDTSGNLLFYTNGCTVLNKKHETVVGSDSLNKGIYKDAFCKSWHGLRTFQGSLFLPKPNHDSIVYLFHTTLNQYGYCLELLLTTVNSNSNNVKGKIIQLNQKLLSDSIEYKITANRHANGRDWWVLVCNHGLSPVKEDYFYKIFVSPDTVQIFKQILGFTPKRKKKYYSQQVFSPDGFTFARYRDGDGVYLYDFDRVTGLLSNIRNIKTNKFDWFGGLSFSPNSRFLYIMAEGDLFQVDMQENDLEKGKEIVAKWDGYKYSGFTTEFGQSQLGPDCKIYVAPQGSLEYICVINYPNRKGKACGVEQRAIKTPTNLSWVFPNLPHYRLGKLGENVTPCDSTINPYITFTKNIKEEVPVTFAVYPNPAQDHINVDLFGYVQRFERGTWDLYDMSGKLAVSFPLLQGHSEYVFDISSVPNGVYIWRVSFNGTPTSFAGKVIVMKE